MGAIADFFESIGISVPSSSSSGGGGGNPNDQGQAIRSTQGTPYSGSASAAAINAALTANDDDAPASASDPGAAARKAAAEQMAKTMAGQGLAPGSNQNVSAKSLADQGYQQVDGKIVSTDASAARNAAIAAEQAALTSSTGGVGSSLSYPTPQNIPLVRTPLQVQADQLAYENRRKAALAQARKGDPTAVSELLRLTRDLSPAQIARLEAQGIMQGGSRLSGTEIGNLRRSDMSLSDYDKGLEDLRSSLDEPRFGAMSNLPILGGLDYLADMEGRRAFEQLTDTYEPSALANPNTARYVPVMEGGQIIGSLSVDRNGVPLAYTGRRSENATIVDPSIDTALAMAKIKGGAEVETAILAGDTNDDVAGECPAGYTFDPATSACVMDTTTTTTTGVAPVNGECPEGYKLDVVKNMCFPTIAEETTGGGWADNNTVALGTPSAYTAAMPTTLPTLAPGTTPFAVPTPNVQPITVAAQPTVPAPQGLASIPIAPR